MKLTFIEKVEMFLRKTSFRKVERLSELLDRYDYPHTIRELEAHFLSGCDFVELCDCVQTLSEESLDFGLRDLVYLQLAGQDMAQVIDFYREHIQDKEANVLEHFLKKITI